MSVIAYLFALGFIFGVAVFLALPFCRIARRDDLEGRGGPRVIGRDVYLDPMDPDRRP